jgi:hypothetical protein
LHAHRQPRAEEAAQDQTQRENACDAHAPCVALRNP